MKYLFFDIEGANCFNFVSKMCTFGYVITNEKFKIKSKIDVVMNPETFFDKHILKEKMNAYPIEFYNSKPPFSYFYKSIASILSANDQIVVGWSIENDVKYIYDACKRYHLKQIKYSYIDMQKVYMKVFQLKNQPSLETVCEENNIKINIVHKSDDDAMLTMLITKAICKKVNLTLPELVNEFKECSSNVVEFSSHIPSDEEINIRINRRKIHNIIKTTKRKKTLINNKIKKEDIYAFDINIIDRYTEEVKKLVHYIVDCGAKCSNNVCNCTKIVCLKEHRKNYKTDTFENIKFVDFQKIINNLKQPI